LDEDAPPLSMSDFSDDSERLEESDSDLLDEHRSPQRRRGVEDEEEEEGIQNENQEEEMEKEEEEGDEDGDVTSAMDLGTQKPLRWGRSEDADDSDDPMEGHDHDYGPEWEEEKEPEHETSKTEV
jgi:hypothetical protein